MTDEPVAWRMREKASSGEWMPWHLVHEDTAIAYQSRNSLDYEVEPLYAAPAPAVEVKGWRLVPVEPTWPMAIAGRDSLCDTLDDDASVTDAKCAYRAMLAALPAAPSGEEQKPPTLKCPTCRGDGNDITGIYDHCQNCDGTGQVPSGKEQR